MTAENNAGLVAPTGLPAGPAPAPITPESLR